jgi:hypothetical protein
MQIDRLGDAQVPSRHTALVRRLNAIAVSQLQLASLRLWLRAYEATA